MSCERCLPETTERKPAPTRGFSRRGAVGAVGAVAVAIALFAVSSGIANQPPDQSPPPGEERIQPKDKADKKPKAPARKNEQRQR